MPGNFNLPTENIDEVILRLLALEPNEVDELDYETYTSYLKELLIEITSSRRKIGGAESDLIKAEFKRIRGKKGRFRIKSKKITATGLGVGKIRGQLKGVQKRLMIAPVGGVGATQKVESISKGTDPLSRINNTVDSILQTLISIDKENRKRNEQERKDAESRRRTGREKDLESKTFEGIKKAISVITKPFQSIWDKIVNFITNIILGRIVLKLIDWFADPKNQDKIQSLIRFFKDHWPVLLALFLRFGTGLGRFIGGLSRLLIKGSLRLIQITANLAARMGLKGAGRLGRFLGGRGGRLLSAGLTIGADVAMTAGAAGVASGDLKVPGFAGGGLNSGFKNIFGNMFSGLVSGPKGRDKVPAMLTDGEFVMSAGAVQKYGVDTLEAMNSAGGGTNIPKVSSGVTYAAGGGQVGSKGKDTSLLKPPAKIIFDRLVRGGLTPTAAAGVVANIGVETGYTYSPNTAQTGGGPGRGIVQWERGGRFDTDNINLMSFAKSRGTAWNNLNTQVDFILHELNNHPEYQSVKVRLNSAKDIPTATRIFLNDYEKAGTPHIEDRLKVGTQIVSAGYLKPQSKPESKPQSNPLQSFFNIFTPPAAVARPTTKKSTPKYAEGGLVPPVNLSKPSRDLKVKPPVRSQKPSISYLSMGPGGQLNGINPPTSSTKPPVLSPTHRTGTRSTQATLGVRK